MDVDDPRERGAVPVSVQAFSRWIRQAKNGIHVVSRNAAISFRISVSLLRVSSKPGVSMRSTRRPSKVKLLES